MERTTEQRVGFNILRVVINFSYLCLSVILANILFYICLLFSSSPHINKYSNFIDYIFLPLNNDFKYILMLFIVVTLVPLIVSRIDSKFRGWFVWCVPLLSLIILTQFGILELVNCMDDIFCNGARQLMIGILVSAVIVYVVIYNTGVNFRKINLRLLLTLVSIEIIAIIMTVFYILFLSF